MLNLILNYKLDQMISNDILIGILIVLGLTTSSYYLGKRIYNYYNTPNISKDEMQEILNKIMKDAYNESKNDLSDNSSTITDSTVKNDNTLILNINDLKKEFSDEAINAVQETTETSTSPIVNTSDISTSPIIKTSDIGIQTSDDLMLDLYKE